ncbi:Hypothetical protein SRAE_X000107800 [Strongyloides ratti]|uniref:Uncharacterized protein n=1 Tax=Strongyloides ratti TaxID=34506 RepID=A0A090KP06_STRRB|nr:Hypothetical protein SRAE_X000107800 [Strongyloides ratti]CEF59328.1 Hypothetical protein SRAE_X000107800 [Strongyloides ratti]
MEISVTCEKKKNKSEKKKKDIPLSENIGEDIPNNDHVIKSIVCVRDFPRLYTFGSSLSMPPRNENEISFETGNGLEVIEEVEEPDEEDNYFDHTFDDQTSLIKTLNHDSSKKSLKDKKNANRRHVVTCVNTSSTFTNVTLDENIPYGDDENRISFFGEFTESNDQGYFEDSFIGTETFFPIPLNATSGQFLAPGTISPTPEIVEENNFLRRMYQTLFLNCFGLRTKQKSVIRPIIRR